MSWNGYIDSIISSCKGNCDKATLIGLNGGACWTTPDKDGHLAITPEEGAALAKAMASNNFTAFQASGIMIAGEKYQFLRSDEEEGYVLGKKKDKGSVTVHKANSVVIIAHTAEGKTQGDTNAGVGGIITYLKDQNM